MNEPLTLPGSWRIAFDHMAAYGAAAIAVDSGFDVRLRWTEEVESHPQLIGITWEEISEVVLKHANDHENNSWVQGRFDKDSGTHFLIEEKHSEEKSQDQKLKGMMSSRVRAQGQDIGYWYEGREQLLDKFRKEDQPQLTCLDFAMIGSLGLPRYWPPFSKQLNQNSATTAWDMTDSGSGRDIVQSLLCCDLAKSMKAFTKEQVTEELRFSRPSSKDPWKKRSGMVSPRELPFARVWCAFWGWSVLSVTPQRNGSITTGQHVTKNDPLFFLPIMTTWWPVAKLKTILRSQQLEFASRTTEDNPSARQWLSARGVERIAVFPVHRYKASSSSRAERWLESATQVLMEAS